MMRRRSLASFFFKREQSARSWTWGRGGGGKGKNPTAGRAKRPDRRRNTTPTTTPHTRQHQQPAPQRNNQQPGKGGGRGQLTLDCTCPGALASDLRTKRNVHPPRLHPVTPQGPDAAARKGFIRPPRKERTGTTRAGAQLASAARHRTHSPVQRGGTTPAGKPRRTATSRPELRQAA